MPNRLLATVWCLFAATAAAAEDLPNGQDLPKGMSLTESRPSYLATRDTFVRVRPDNNAERIGQIGKGQRVAASGKIAVAKSKGSYWLALKLPGKKTGYVFGSSFVPAIDGTLLAPLRGNLSAADRPSCSHEATFEGRTQVADELQQTADYDILFSCRLADGTPLQFGAGMFITELPFDDRREAHQINIDMWDMRVNEEDVLSITAIYDPDEKRVSFDRINDDALAQGVKLAPETASDVPSALIGAIKLAYLVLPPAAWEKLAAASKAAAADASGRAGEAPSPFNPALNPD